MLCGAFWDSGIVGLRQWFLERGRVNFADGLTDEQVVVAMDAFNHYSPLTQDEINILRPVLQNVLLAVLAGVIAIVDHVWNLCIDYPSSMGAKLPPELDGDGFVDLRERRLDEED